MSRVQALSDSIDIAASPERVWSLVSDLSRMARWSPQVVRTFVRGGPVGVGTRAINLNRKGLLFWPTRSEVVVYEPHRELAFRILDNATIWAYVLEPTATGTRLRHERRTPDGVTAIAMRLQDAVLGGVESFTEELRAGMRETLTRIKAEAEA